jgi:hypothetical protein
MERKRNYLVMSRIMATPELDKPDEEVKPNTGSNDGQKGNR